MKKLINKMALVRDNIPHLIKKKGCACNYIILHSDKDYQAMLKSKLVEEANEVRLTSSKDEIIEELADCLEVIKCLKESFNITDEEIENRRSAKEQSKGSFKKRFYLHSFEENE